MIQKYLNVVNHTAEFKKLSRNESILVKIKIEN